ncbi:MAG: hypothetical protein JWP89_2882 [Schlesneria sp.]|nr:hypothetical protein [Schlesneria sp.]
MLTEKVSMGATVLQKYSQNSDVFILGCIGFCPQAQGAGTLPSRGPSAPEQDFLKRLWRPEGPAPLVPDIEIGSLLKCPALQAFGSLVMGLIPGPKGPGWIKYRPLGPENNGPTDHLSGCSRARCIDTYAPKPWHPK